MNPNTIRVGVDQQGADPTIQQATANLFADMQAFPATPQPTLVIDTRQARADLEPPTCQVLSATPAAGGGGGLVVHGLAADTGGGVVAAVEVSAGAPVGGRPARWHPASPGPDGFVRWAAVLPGSGLGVLGAAGLPGCRAVDDSGNMSAEDGAGAESS